jgi:hypothetical protein
MDKETVLVMDWLKDIEHTKSEDEKTQKDKALVVYVLNLQEERIDGLTLTLGQVTYLKKGGFSKIKPLPSIWSDKKIPLSDAAILGKLNYACDSDVYSDPLSFFHKFNSDLLASKLHY